MPGQRSASIHHFAHPSNVHLHQIPPPSLPADFQSFPPLTDLTDLQNGLDFCHVGENLNPDVPEFIPVTVRIQGENDDQNLAQAEGSESEEHREDKEVSHEGMQYQLLMHTNIDFSLSDTIFK
jgi:hypothetical protein